MNRIFLILTLFYFTSTFAQTPSAEKYAEESAALRKSIWG